jgi:hypothetical protein
MRPLNRPMFKMGGPVKEGIMDGIREPKANGGTIGGGAIVGEDKGGGRTGFFNPLLASLGTAGLATLRASPRFLKDIGKSIFTKPRAAGIATPTKPSFFSMQGLRNLLPTQRFRTLTPTVSRTTDRVKDATGSYSPVKFSSKQLSFKEAFKDPKIIGQAIRENPFTTIYAPSFLTGAATMGGPAVKSILKTAIDTAIPGERFDLFKDKPEPAVGQKGNTVGQRGSDTIDPSTKKGNKFNDDGSKKETSVSRLLKAVEKRSRDAAVADSLIAAGEEIRTGGIDSDTVGNITQRVSKEFDKDVELKQKLDLARIESELKKEQIAAQAIATDPIALDRRRRAQLSLNEIRTQDKGGVVYGAKGGAKLLAQEFERNTGVKYQGSLGGDDALKDLKKTDDFKLSPESVVKESIEKIVQPGGAIGGYNGTYTLGEDIYEYLNGVVKKLK